jgi:NAD(P)-dependent dehydrogenase (short-subunit alcohol dehydrogenase family)
LAIPDAAIRHAGVYWGDRVNIQGRVRFLQDAGLDETAARVHHARPLIVFVDKLEGIVSRPLPEPIVISPVALFESRSDDEYDRAHYTFVQCGSGSDAELDIAVEWIEQYTNKHMGRVITNFDEQRPSLADAPLSYQRLVAKNYDRNIITSFGGTIRVDRIDKLVQTSVYTHHYGGIHVGHKINVGGSAIINIDSVLSNVTQTIGAAPGLDSAQKSQLEGLVQSLRADLDKRGCKSHR